MSVYWHVMVSGNYCSHTRAKIGDYSPAVLIPYFIYLLELVSIDPFDQDLLLLFIVFCSDFDEGSDEQLVGENCNVSIVMFSLVVVWLSR
jgi:hypothetical protein